MHLTQDAFRALAQSSPWRWRTLHFTCAGPAERVEAWLRRPGQLLVRDSGGRRHHVDERGRAGEGTPALRSLLVPHPDDPDEPVAVPRHRPSPRWPHELEPVWRDDGLVGVRPDSPWVEYGDPMWQNYYWVALLDPVELSHHTAVTGLREEDRLGRRTWWARVAAEEGYDPTCGCCPLLWSWFSDRDEYADDDEPATWTPCPGTVYPAAYDVALDVQTGVVVELRPTTEGSRPTGHRLEIHEVDADLAGLFPG